MENVVTAVFDVESEAYQAFAEIRKCPFGEGYVVAEAALLKREGDAIGVVDMFDAAGITIDDTNAGVVIGSLVGILGGPLGVLLGASIGGLAGSRNDSIDTINSMSLLEVAASKLFDGEVAIIALVSEEEPAFDAAFEKFQTTIIRQFAVDIMAEVELARTLLVDLANQAKQRMRADIKAEKAEKREERKAAIKAKFESLKDKFAAYKQDLRDTAAQANANLLEEVEKAFDKE